MPTRRRALAALAGVVLPALAGCGTSGGSDGATTAETEANAATQTATGTGTTRTAGGDDELSITSPAFDDGASIPAEFTANGANVSPPLSLSGIPAETTTWAVVVDDPDAPGGTFVHWLLWNVPADTPSLPRDVQRTETVESLGGARQGTNGFGAVGYRGPAPPADDGPHTYRFTAHALDRSLDVQAGAKRGALANAMADARLATGRLTGTYDR